MIIWKKPVAIDQIKRLYRNTLCEHLGMEFTDVGDDHLTAKMPVDARTNQPLGILHGGASCALAETVGSVAANFCIEEDQVALGLDLNINHIRQVKAGFITAVTKPLHLGKTTHVWEIKIYNETKQLIAAARLTMAVMKKR